MWVSRTCTKVSLMSLNRLLKAHKALLSILIIAIMLNLQTNYCLNLRKSLWSTTSPQKSSSESTMYVSRLFSLISQFLPKIIMLAGFGIHRHWVDAIMQILNHCEMAMYLVSVLNSDISALVEFNFLIIILILWNAYSFDRVAITGIWSIITWELWISPPHDRKIGYKSMVIKQQTPIPTF